MKATIVRKKYKCFKANFYWLYSVKTHISAYLQAILDQLNEVVETRKSIRKCEESQELIFSQGLYCQYIIPRQALTYRCCHPLPIPQPPDQPNWPRPPSPQP